MPQVSQVASKISKKTATSLIKNVATKKHSDYIAAPRVANLVTL